MKNKKPYNSQTNSDDHIKNMFRDFQAPYHPESWDMLSEKLDNAIPFVPLNDSEIKEDLASISMPYDSASWKILQNRMDLFDSRKKWIFRGKIAELAMFFFLFYMFTGSINHPSDPKHRNIDIAIKGSKTSGESNNTENVARYSEATESTASLATSQNTPTDKSITGPASNHKNETQAANETDSKVIITNNPPTIQSGIAAPDKQSTLPVSEIKLESEPQLLEPFNPLAASSALIQSNEENLKNDLISNLAKLPLLSANIKQENQEKNDLILPVLHPANFQDKKISFLVGAVIGYDKDLIKSPFPHQKSEVMLGRIEDNFRMGLSLHMDMNTIEISSGVHYLIKNYKSVYAGENQVRIAHIPIMLKLKLPFAGFMRGYVAGGVSGNYVIHANYQEHDYFRDRPQLDYVENNGRAAGYSLLSSSNYKNGIFEGETIRGNHFYTANIAIGLEANLNKTYSLFFEQAYSHQLKGRAIGPAFDHFFSSTSLMGIRYRIVKNSNRILHTQAGNSLR